jgi:hypothetical protein
MYVLVYKCNAMHSRCCIVVFARTFGCCIGASSERAQYDTMQVEQRICLCRQPDVEHKCKREIAQSGVDSRMQ